MNNENKQRLQPVAAHLTYIYRSYKLLFIYRPIRDKRELNLLQKLIMKLL